MNEKGPKGIIILVGQNWNKDFNDLDFVANKVSELSKDDTKVVVVIVGDGNLSNFEEVASNLKSVLCKNQHFEHGLINVTENCKSLAESTYHGKIYLDRLLPDIQNIHLIHGRIIDREYIKLLFQEIYHPPAYNLHQYHPESNTVGCVTLPPDQTLKDKVSQTLMNFARGLPAFDKQQIIHLKSSLISSSLFSHGFSTRFGGISTNKFLSSLNLSFKAEKKDPMFCVEENRRRFAKACSFDPQNIKVAKCAHKAGVWAVGVDTEPAKYDAMVTSQVEVTLMAPGADCAPVLFSDPVKKVCGVAHAGWKGIIAEIGKAVIQIMVTQFHSDPKHIVAAIGPSIGPCCYEVGEEVSKQFIERYGHDVVMQPQSSSVKPHLDLRRAIRLQLEECGLVPDNIDDGTRSQDLPAFNKVTFCTSCDEDRQFFSSRRDKIGFGSHVGFINIKSGV